MNFDEFLVSLSKIKNIPLPAETSQFKMSPPFRTELISRYKEAMKDAKRAGVLANAKHFPGHGDTESDSHKTLPSINFDEKRIDSVELYPYKQLIKQGLSSVMVAHLNVPSLEKRFLISRLLFLISEVLSSLTPTALLILIFFSKQK